MSARSEIGDVYVPHGQITLRYVLVFLRRARWTALTSAGLCCIIALILAEVVPAKYVATVTLLPTESGGAAFGARGVLSTASKFSGLASLAGINLGGESGLATEAIATLRSRLLLNKYIQQHNLLPILFSSKWDSARNTWDTTDPKDIPTLWNADRLFHGHIMTVHETARGGEQGVITLKVVWTDPNLASQWANGLVKLTNDYLREKSIAESNRDIAYLSHEVANMDIVEVKESIYSLMEEEIKSEMVAKGRRQFALRVIDPATPAREPISPKPLLWTIEGAVGGVFLGLLIAVLREALRTEGSEKLV